MEGGGGGGRVQSTIFVILLMSAEGATVYVEAWSELRLLANSSLLAITFHTGGLLSGRSKFPIKFSLDPDLSDSDCHKLLNHYTPQHIKRNKTSQKFFIRCAEKLCGVYDTIYAPPPPPPPPPPDTMCAPSVYCTTQVHEASLLLPGQLPYLQLQHRLQLRWRPCEERHHPAWLHPDGDHVEGGQ